MRHREVKEITQGHTASTWQSLGLDPEDRLLGLCSQPHTGWPLTYLSHDWWSHSRVWREGRLRAVTLVSLGLGEVQGGGLTPSLPSTFRCSTGLLTAPTLPWPPSKWMPASCAQPVSGDIGVLSLLKSQHTLLRASRI